ncbi:hypothetical protein HN415_00385, partial [Candidatus Woesearchaeota archaeon]|nr:hypothetical protein [Candidatus Woesearchaeota archaeon]
LVILFLVGSFSLILYMDYTSLRDGFGEEKTMFILEDNGVILTGLTSEKNEEIIYHVFTTEELIIINEKFKDDNLKEVKGESKRLFIVNVNFFDALDEDVTFVGQYVDKMKKETIKKVMVSATPLESYIDLSIINDSIKDEEKVNLSEEFRTDEDFRSSLFLLSTNEILEEKGVKYIYKEYKNGNVVVYPKTMVFFLIKVMPSWLMNLVLWVI